MKEKVNVTGVPETMVQTLYARAKETRKKNAKINDEIAEELVKNLDYDFSKADKDKAMNYGVIARTIVLDRMVEQYLEKNANTIVINIACGLDTRCYRMEGKYLRWYNVDLPETMEIREKCIASLMQCFWKYSEMLAARVSSAAAIQPTAVFVPYGWTANRYCPVPFRQPERMNDM